MSSRVFMIIALTLALFAGVVTGCVIWRFIEQPSVEDTYLCDEDPRDYLAPLEDWQKEDCLEWAFGIAASQDIIFEGESK